VCVYIHYTDAKRRITSKFELEFEPLKWAYTGFDVYRFGTDEIIQNERALRSFVELRLTTLVMLRSPVLKVEPRQIGSRTTNYVVDPKTSTSVNLGRYVLRYPVATRYLRLKVTQSRNSSSMASCVFCNNVFTLRFSIRVFQLYHCNAVYA
jgi:ribosomal protein L37AE/L43A